MKLNILYLYFIIKLILVNEIWAFTKVAVISDLNSSYGSTTYNTNVRSSINNIIENSNQLVLIPGDMVAGQSSSLTDADLVKMWRGFERYISGPLRQNLISIAPSPGNHDAAFSNDRIKYKQFVSSGKLLNNIQPVDMTHYPFFYSFMHEGVFYISLDDVNDDTLVEQPHKVGVRSNWPRLKRSLDNINTYFEKIETSLNKAQNDWLQEQIEKVQFKEAKSRIVFGHIPLFSILDPTRYDDGHGGGKYNSILKNEQLPNPNGLENILIKGKVDLVIFGHSHAYFAGKVIYNDSSISPLRILFNPCSGQGTRHLPGADERSAVGHVELNISNEGKIEIEMRNADGSLTDLKTLPERIQLPGRPDYILRDDL